MFEIFKKTQIENSKIEKQKNRRNTLNSPVKSPALKFQNPYAKKIFLLSKFSKIQMIKPINPLFLKNFL